MGPAPYLFRECLDGLLHSHNFLLNLRLALLSSQLDVPDLTAFGGVHDITIEHSTDAVCHTLVCSNLRQEGKALAIDLGMRVVEPDLIKDFESQALVAALVLQELAEMCVLGHSLVVLFERLD